MPPAMHPGAAAMPRRSLLLALAVLHSHMRAALAAVEVHGSGTTNPSKFFWKIMETFQARSSMDLELTYRAVGSGTGQKEFSSRADGDYASGLSDFGAGDIPMSSTHYQGITNAGRQMVHVPFSLGAIGIFHSVPADEVGTAGLKLSPCVLAKIFSGQITTWDHVDIKAENPDLSVPAGTKIQVGHRRLGSSSTGGTSGYLNAKCPASWTMAGTGTPMGTGSSITWPSLDNFNEVEGSPGMTALIADTDYAIGYLDAGHGHQRGFAEVMLRNEDNAWLTSTMALAAVDQYGNNGVAAAGKAAVDAGDIPADVTQDWSAVNLYGKSGANTWPIVLVSYIYLPKDMSGLSNDKAGLVKAFVDYVTGESGQGMLGEFSFNRIPAAMNRWGNTWASVITKPASPTVFTFEESTSAWTGQGPTVISAKRNAYSMWKLNELDLALASVLERVTSLESSLNDYGIVPLHGSGTTNPKNWFAKAMGLMEERARVPMILTYRAVGSSTGQKEFLGNAASGFTSYSHFGAGDIPMSQDRYGQLTAQSPPAHMVHLPFALGAIGIFHSVPMASGDLQLDACLLAKIFSGAIRTWDHSEIKDQNPGLSVPADEPILVGHRTLGSSSTGGLAGYLHKKCPGHWPLGTSSTLSWPNHASFHAVQGSPGMQEHIRTHSYAIGYLDAGHGHDFSFAEVALTNHDGATRTSRQSIALGGVADAGSQGVATSVFPSDAAADWSAVNLYDMPGQNTWPIVLVSYLYVKKDQTATNPKTAAALGAFIDTIVTNRDGLCQEFGFTAPSTTLQNLAVNAANTIVYPPGVVDFTFETSTDPWNGMGTRVLSVKRHSFDDYERSRMQAELETIKAQLAASTASASAPAPAPAEEGGSDALSIVALIVSVVALLVTAVGVLLIVRKARASS